MYKFGKTSQARLNTCHIDLQKICNEVIKNIDFSVLEGARTLAKQQEYFNAKPPRTTLDGINKKSKHQVTKEKPLSTAVDVAPYPIDFKNQSKARARFYFLAGYFFQASKTLFDAVDITPKLIWGGNWDNDFDFEDQTFDDLPHFELVKA